MIIAAEKKRTNIVEYVLYMWYIEDLVRAHNLDRHKIVAEVVDRFDQEPEVKDKMMQWYDEIIHQMHQEGLASSGHLPALITLVYDLNDLHLTLINEQEQEEYRQLYHRVQSFISEIKRKMRPETTEVEACLNALYGVMLLRLRGQEPSTSTREAVTAFSQLLAVLNQHYMLRYSGS